MCERVEHVIAGQGRKRVAVVAGAVFGNRAVAGDAPVSESRRIGVDDGIGLDLLDQISRSGERIKVPVAVAGSDDESDPSRHLGGVGRKRVDVGSDSGRPYDDVIDVEFSEVVEPVVFEESVVVAPVEDASDSVVPEDVSVEGVSAGVAGRVVEDAGIPLSAEQFLRSLLSEELPPAIGSVFDACLARIRLREKNAGKESRKPAAIKKFRGESIAEILNTLGYDGKVGDGDACLDLLQELCAGRFTSGNILALDTTACHQRVPSFIFRHESGARTQALAELEARMRREVEEAIARRQLTSRPVAPVVEMTDVKKTLTERLVALGREAPQYSASRGVPSEDRFAWQRKSSAILAKLVGVAYDPCLEQGQRIQDWYPFLGRLIQACIEQLGITEQRFNNDSRFPNFLKDLQR